MKEIIINSEYITLGQFLKKINEISSGGQAKFFLLETQVFVNDIHEQRRGRKLYSNDIIKIDEQVYCICN